MLVRGGKKVINKYMQGHRHMHTHPGVVIQIHVHKERIAHSVCYQ